MIAAALLRISNACHVGLVKSCLAVITPAQLETENQKRDRGCGVSSKQYREFADECLGWAKTARSERERQIFLQMAQTWLQAGGLAEQREGGLNVDTTPPARSALARAQKDEGGKGAIFETRYRSAKSEVGTIKEAAAAASFFASPPQCY